MHRADTYGIIDIAQIDSVDFSQVPEENNENLRKSIDGSKFVIKWYHGEEPTFITDGSVTPLQTLTHAECLALMATAEWSEEIE
jgi:hypothetical protein